MLPAFGGIGTVSIKFNLGSFQILTDPYYVPIYNDLQIKGINPSFGKYAGNILTTITGNHFINISTLGCRFGLTNHTIPATFINTTAILCKVPSVEIADDITQKTTNIYVTTNGWDWFENTTINYTWHLPLFIDYISPSFGDLSGNTAVTIYGKNFINQSMLCNFGNDTIIATFVSMTQIICNTPSRNTSQTNDLTLSITNNQDKSDTRIKYRWVNEIEIYDIHPLHGPTYGNTIVTIWVKNLILTPLLSCAFNNINNIQTAVYITNYAIKCVSPNSTNGSQSIIYVSNNQIDWHSYSINYTYESPVLISQIIPNQGSYLGSTLITVFGNYFKNYTTLFCKFTYNATLNSSLLKYDVMPATFLNTSSVYCNTPQFHISQGIAVVTVTMNAEDFSLNSSQFMFYKQPMITKLLPDSGAYSK